MADKKISALTGASTPLDGTEVLPIVQSGATVKVANNDLRPKQIQSNATSGVLQVAGPSAGATRVMTTPDANFTAARTDAAQTISALQTVSVIGNTATNSANIFDLLVSGGAAKYGTIRLSDNATYSAWINWNNAQLLLTGPGATSGFQLDASGNAKVENGNLVIGTSGAGIDFSATAGSGTSELLADYEEGTWTPNQGAGLTVVGAFSSTGIYTKIGRIVTVQGTVSGATSIAVASGALIITSNLPFSSNGGFTGVMYDSALSSSPGIVSAANIIYSLGSMAATASITFSVTYFV